MAFPSVGTWAVGSAASGAGGRRVGAGQQASAGTPPYRSRHASPTRGPHAPRCRAGLSFPPPPRRRRHRLAALPPPPAPSGPGSCRKMQKHGGRAGTGAARAIGFPEGRRLATARSSHQGWSCSLAGGESWGQPELEAGFPRQEGPGGFQLPAALGECWMGPGLSQVAGAGAVARSSLVCLCGSSSDAGSQIKSNCCLICIRCGV